MAPTMLAFLFAAALAAAPPLDARHASLLALMRRTGACADAAPGVCERSAAGAEIRPLGRVHGDEIALVSFAFDGAICGNVNCPYFVVRFWYGGARKLLWTDGYSIAVAAGSPLPSLKVTSRDSADTNYLTRYDWRGGTYVRTKYLRVRLATGEMRPALIPVVFAPHSPSSVVRGSVTSYWNANYELNARSGQRLVVSAIASAMPLWIMLDGPDGLPVAGRVVPGTPYALPASGPYELSIYLDVTQHVERDQPFRLTLTLR